MRASSAAIHLAACLGLLAVALLAGCEPIVSDSAAAPSVGDPFPTPPPVVERPAEDPNESPLPFPADDPVVAADGAEPAKTCRCVDCCCDPCVCGAAEHKPPYPESAASINETPPAYESPDRELVCIGAAWCARCLAAHAASEGVAGVRWLDFDADSSEVARLWDGTPFGETDCLLDGRPGTLPVFVATQDGEPVRRFWPYRGGMTHPAQFEAMRDASAHPASPEKHAAVPTAPTLHTHRCDACGTQWSHVDGSHNCPRCGRFQNVVDHWGGVNPRPAASPPVTFSQPCRSCRSRR